MNSILQDLRYGLRLLRKSPGFTVVAVLTLALGIGANTAIFTVIHGVLLNPLPYPEPDRLVALFNPTTDGFVKIGEFSPQDFEDLARESKSYSAITDYEYIPGQTSMTLTGNGEPLRVNAAFVSGAFFQVFSARPTVGRLLLPSDDGLGKNSQVVISERLWRSRFSSDPNIAGREAIFNGSSFTIVGVAPRQMQIPDREVDLWAPLTLVGDKQVPHIRQLRWLSAAGRLKPGVSIQQAHSEANVIMARLAKLYPDTNDKHERAIVKDLHESMVGEVRPALMILLATVAIVLLIACANLANLVLARGTGRVRELAIRSALGAEHGRIVRQLLTESVLLSLIGGAFGVFIAYWCIQIMKTLGESSIPRADAVSLNWTVLLFAFVLSLVTGVIFGLIPALRGTGFDFQHALKDASYTTSEGSKRRFIRNGLIVGEVGLAAVLLVASLLVVKSLWKLTHVDPGFNAANVLSIRIVTPQQHTASREESTAYRLELIRRVAEVPGVISAGASKTLPLQGGGEPYGFVYKSARGDVTVKPEAGVFVASPGYFKALQIPLICGRVFTEQDNAPNASPVLLVNQALASRIWPGEDPVGKALSLGNASATIVGVIGNVRSEGLSSEPRGAIYGPMGIFPRSSLYIFARTDGNPLAIASGVRQAIWNYEKNQAIDMAPLQGSLEADVAQPRYFTLLLGTFGTMALVLAGIGIYGVISYNVHQQLREIGIRMALGAQPSQVLSMVLGGAIRLAGIGLVLGTVVALVASRALRSLLFGVSAVDSSMYALMILVLMSVALLASYVPARRATKVDPMVALRYE